MPTKKVKMIAAWKNGKRYIDALLHRIIWQQDFHLTNMETAYGKSLLL